MCIAKLISFGNDYAWPNQDHSEERYKTNKAIKGHFRVI